MLTTNILPDNLEIIALLNSKFFHDLAGLIGAIGNSAEFLQEGMVSEQVVELISESAEDAIYKLKIFRQAYGETPDDMLNKKSFADLESQIKNYLQRKKIPLLWNVNLQKNSAFYPAFVNKILFNIAILAGDLLTKNGHLSLTIEEGRQDNEIHFVAIFDGNNINGNNKVIGSIKGNASNLSEHNIQAYFLHLITQNTDTTFNINDVSEQLIIESFI